MLDEGTWCDEGPPVRIPPRRPSPWDEVIDELKARPGRWWRSPGRSRQTTNYLRGRYPDPHLIIEGHDGYRDDNGTRRIELWLCWKPNEPETT